MPLNKQEATELINSSLREGAELRAIIARDCSSAIFEAASLIVDCLRNGGKLLFFGNGGSAADAQHLAAEFVGRFVSERAALAAISLTTDSSILTAVGNDYGFDQVFARQVQARPSGGRCCGDQHERQFSQCFGSSQRGEETWFECDRLDRKGWRSSRTRGTSGHHGRFGSSSKNSRVPHRNRAHLL